MLTGLLLKILGSMLTAGGKIAVKHFLTRTPTQKAISSTSADFPSIPVTKDSLTRWCQSDEFLALIESLQKGEIDTQRSEDEIINSFIEIGLFHDGLTNTFESARQVLHRFAEHLEKETYKSDEGLYVESRRAKNRHLEGQAKLDSLSAELNSQTNEIKELIQEQSAKSIPFAIRTEIIKLLDRIDENTWEQESKNIRRLIETPQLVASSGYAEISISENRVPLTGNSRLTEASVHTNSAPILSTNFVGRLEIIEEIEASISESRLIVIAGISGVGKTELLKQIASCFEPAKVFWYDFQPGLINFDDLLNRLARFLEAQSTDKTDFIHLITARYSQISLQDKIDLIIEGLNKFPSNLFFDRINLTDGILPFSSFFSQLKERLQHSNVFVAGGAAPEFITVVDEISESTKLIPLEGLTAEEIQEFWKRKNISISIETAEKLELNLDGLPAALDLLSLLVPENTSEEILLEYAEKAKERAVEYLFDKVYSRLEQNDKELLITASLLNLPFSSKQLLSVHKVITGRNSQLSFQTLERQSLIKKQIDDFYKVPEIINNLALTYAEADLDKRCVLMAEYLFEEMPDDITAQLETVLLYVNGREFDKAVETVLSIMQREFIVYSPDIAEMLVEMFSKEKVSTENWIWLLGEKGRIAEFWNQSEIAETHYKEMLEAARRLGDQKAESIALMRLGISFIDRDEKLSEQYYSESLKLLMDLDDVDGQADIYSNFGVLYSQQGEYEKAETAFLKCLELHESLNSPDWQKYGVVTNLGILYARQKKWDEAFKQSRDALRIAEETGSPYHIARAIYNLGIHEWESENAEEALKQFEDALNTAIEFDFWEVEEMVRIALGLFYADLKNFTEAINNFQRVIEIREELEDFVGVVTLNFDIGTFYSENNNLGKALEYYLKGLEGFEHLDEKRIDIYSVNIRILARKLGTSDELFWLLKSLRQLKKKLAGFGCTYALARIYGVLGDIYLDVLRRDRIGFSCLVGETEVLSELGYFSEQALAKRELAFHYQSRFRLGDAIKINGEAEQIAEQNNLVDLLAGIRFNIGNCFVELEMLLEAEKYYRSALEVAIQNDDREFERTVQHNLGEILRRQGKYDEAIELINLSLEYCRETDDFSGIVSALNNLGLVYEEQNDNIRSAKLFNEAIETARSYSLHAQEANALISLGNLFIDKLEIARGHFEQALKAARVAQDIEMEEGAMLSLGIVHHELGTFDNISAEFQIVAERANELEHNENLIKMLVLGGEVNLKEEGGAEPAAEMFEKALFFAYQEGLKSILQFQDESFKPFHFAHLTHVLVRLIATMTQAFKPDSSDLPNLFYKELKRKIYESDYWSEKDFIMRFLQPIENYLEEMPAQSLGEYIFANLAEFN